MSEENTNIERRRAELLREHADAVLKAEAEHRLAWNTVLDDEMRPMLRDGMPPDVAELAATNNLAHTKDNFDWVLTTNILGLQKDLRRKLRQLAGG
jgi:hypothetical protein